MNLKEKLAKIDRTQPATIKREKEIYRSDLLELLPGEEWETAAGCCWRNRVYFDLDHFHGDCQISQFLLNESTTLQFIAKRADAEQVQLDQLIFVDTETTGLSGGVGTLAFLIGIGYFENGKFIIDQYFMRGFDEERALITAFLQFFHQLQSPASALVSFNGKSYDLPLVLNRAIFHGLIRSQPSFIHFDLVHPVRRLWKSFLPDCTLNTLEAELLCVKRHGDVPGYLIPELFFRFLRNKDPRPLLAVFRHNQIDILSMVSILHLMLQIFAQKNVSDNIQIDWLAMGNIYEEMSDYDRGMDLYRKLMNEKLAGTNEKQAILRMAGLYKKKREYQSAVQLWQMALGHQNFSVEPYEELAKTFEHRLMDLQKARDYTIQALDNIRVLEQLRGNRTYIKEKERLQWRLNRLNRKLSKGHR